jgi:hypothetical protein
MAEQLNYNINVSGNASESVGSLKKQLREAQAEVGALSDKFGATSKEAVIAAKRAAELKDRIGDAKALTEAFNPDAKFKALSASLSGVAGGFAAVQGAIGLFGAESKELEKQLLKVQSALALSQGLQSIGESIDSFKQLGAVIQSTTIFTKANSAANALTAATLKAVGISAETTAISFRVLKTAIVSTGIGVLVIALGELVSALMNYTSATDKAKKKQEELNEVLKNSSVEGLKAAKGFVKSQAELNALRAKSEGATEEEITKIRIKGINDQINLNKSKYEELLKLDKKAASELADENASLQDELTKIELDGIIKRNENRKKEQEDRERKEKERRLKEIQKRVEGRIDEDPLIALETKRQEAIKSTEAVVKGSLEANLQALGSRVNAETQAATEKKKLDDEAAQYVEDREQAKQDAYAMTADALGVLGEVVGRETAAGKALSSAQALINTFLGITQIWASKSILPEPIGTAAKVAATATAAASGFLAVRNINKVNVPKGGGGASVPSFSASPLTPSSASLLTTSLSQQSINAIGNSAIRAYVVETDITSNQKRVQAIKQRARFS